MLNMLVIIENKNIGIKLINKISKENNNIRLYSLCNSIDEAINILDSTVVDFIILELNHKNLFGTEILQYLLKKSKNEYFNSIIAITTQENIHNPFIFDYITTPVNITKLYNSISNICNYKEESDTNLIIKNRIIKILKYLNYDLSHIGTKYLIETIYEIYHKKDYLGDNLKKNIYSILAKKYNKSINTIYGDIKQATKKMYENSDKKILIDFFCLEKLRKPKVTEVIFKTIYIIKKTSLENK